MESGRLRGTGETGIQQSARKRSKLSGRGGPAQVLVVNDLVRHLAGHSVLIWLQVRNKSGRHGGCSSYDAAVTAQATMSGQSAK